MDAKFINGTNAMTEHQEYEYSLPENPRTEEWVFKWGAWRRHEPNSIEKKYPKIHIRFGVRDAYYDPCY